MTFLTSRTDALDRWFHSGQRDDATARSAPKPTMVPSPLAPLIDDLQSRNVTGWLSIGATLLSLATASQHKTARHGDELLDNPSPSGRGRSLTVPVTDGTDPEQGWLFVWATRPARQHPDDAEKDLRGYLRAKKHQLGLPRGVVFLYDEPTRTLVGVFYDGHTGPLDATLTASLHTLLPATYMQRSIHPNVKRLSQGTKGTPKRKMQRPKR
ncbi:hypothetical protein [Streptomyces sp. adm13(2018)]|uniref:hypothetical protein n=1 Tax=Streptomyces sp. adm13(2018) TaxID=2479007 RepID=UPI0011CDF2C3|nr:hypothetical protein [Streptomyces sp. adm13(2018)]